MNKPKCPLTKTPLALAIATTMIAGAHAQSNEDAAEARVETDVIEVHGQKTTRDPASMKFTRPLLDTAQTINVIPRDLIEERAATSLRDVLRNVSGISMQAGEGGTPSGDQLSIRGYSARTDIFVDNVRDFGGYTRDPFNLEQVEVVKGPSSDYSGRGSTGGSINLVSKAPQLADETQSSVSLGTDSFARATLDTNKTLSESSAARLNLMYHEQDVAGRNEVNNQRFGIAPSIAFGLERDTQVTLSAFYLEQDNLPDYGIPWVPDVDDDSNIAPELLPYENEAPPVDFENWYGLTARDHEDISTSMVSVQVDQLINDKLRMRNLTRWGMTERESMITAPRFYVDNGVTTTQIRRSDEKYRDQENDILSNQTDFRLDITSGKLEHKIAFGFEVALEGEKRYTQQLTGSDSPTTDLWNPTPNDPYLENYQRTGTHANADTTNLAAFVSDSIQIGDHWQINGGLRWDRFSAEYTPDGGTLVDQTDKMLSYRAGVVYKPVQNGSIYIGYGTSFNPSAENLTISSNQQGVDPEENETIELGTKWEVFGGQALVSAAVFQTEKTNARTTDPSDTVLVLEGNQEVQGVELGISGRVSQRLSLYAGYTHLSTEITDSNNADEVGQEFSNAPEDSISLWAGYSLVDNLQLGFGAQYVGDRYNNTSNVRVAPEYWVYEASANYSLNDRLSFRLNVQNLTDEEYIDYVGGGHFIPGLGRMAMLSSTFSF